MRVGPAPGLHGVLGSVEFDQEFMDQRTLDRVGRYVTDLAAFDGIDADNTQYLLVARFDTHGRIDGICIES